MAIFLITAPSGAGKTTISQALMDKGVWNECISHTTRPMREGEIDGKTYYYIDKDEFKKMFNNGEFAEHVSYDGNLYGVSKSEINRVIDGGNHVFVIVEYNGYLQMMEKYPNAVSIFLYASKEECMVNMINRGDKMNKVSNRVITYEKEMKNRNEFDYVIKNVNGKFDETLAVIENIVAQYGI